jgi:hypothetical protein
MKFIRFYEQKRHQLCRIIVYQRVNDKLEKEAKHTSTSHQYVLRKLDTIKKSTLGVVFSTLNNNLSPLQHSSDMLISQKKSGRF